MSSIPWLPLNSHCTSSATTIPSNGVIAPLSKHAFDYYSGNKELQAANGEGANCVEFDIGPLAGKTKKILKEDPLFNPGDPNHQWVLRHPKDIIESKLLNIGPSDYGVPEKAPKYSQGGGIHNQALPSIKGWGTLPSGTEAFLSRLSEWLRGTIKVGKRIIRREIGCAMIDTKFPGWPNTSDYPYAGKYDHFAKDLINYLRFQ